MADRDGVYKSLTWVGVGNIATMLGHHILKYLLRIPCLNGTNSLTIVFVYFGTLYLFMKPAFDNKTLRKARFYKTIHNKSF